MPIYTINLTDLQNTAVEFKAAQLGKTKAEIFDDFVVGGLISAWIREMIDADVGLITKKWDSLTQVQKDKIKAIAGGLENDG